MTNEQKAAVQKAALAAARSVEQRDTPIATAIERSSVAKWFKAGAQTVLDNPISFGLYSLEDMRKSFYAGHNLCDDEMREVEYWKKRAEAAERYINESPCDPDITPTQEAAYDAWQEIVKQEPK